MSSRAKKTVILGLLIFMIISAVGLNQLRRPFARIDHLDSKYMTTTRGMTVAEVVTVMGEQPSVTIGAAAWWDDVRLGPDQDNKVKTAIRYTVRTFFLPVTFEFTFDEEGKLLGRHRFD